MIKQLLFIAMMLPVMCSGQSVQDRLSLGGSPPIGYYDTSGLMKYYTQLLAHDCDPFISCCRPFVIDTMPDIVIQDDLADLKNQIIIQDDGKIFVRMNGKESYIRVYGADSISLSDENGKRTLPMYKPGNPNNRTFK